MAHAISNTFKSITGSSVTTVAGFAALCFMTFALGANLGIVMAKGVIIGVICCVTVLPSLILICDKLIEKTHHRSLMPDLTNASHFITKHYKTTIVVFLILLFQQFMVIIIQRFTIILINHSHKAYRVMWQIRN